MFKKKKKFKNYLLLLYKKIYAKKRPINKPTKGTSLYGGNWILKCWTPMLS